MKKLTLLLSTALLLSANAAYADECTLSLDANDMMQFSTKTLSAPKSCKKVTVKLSHVGKLPANVMGHNWVLASEQNMKAIITDGNAAGLSNHYLKPNDTRVLAATDIIGGGKSTQVTFNTSTLTAGTNYTYFCSFPGHYAMMKGTFTLN
ncbi:azurin [Pseudoalteromonas arctica]|uniref:Azurin n=1 Tax=Pseudoalteromonas arctica TaxID=394751 RepID=A0AAP6XZI3_9GAMM|nr:azurin [Pseudoalteromonas arctica]NMP02333.1 azurin [Pseudoalteromonas arctica]